ncbi:hypothetical protein M3Y97_00366000 [Aphelenchoides bicaudatus]|nr:hypothetical protein M3Y97_00366000 [Aphelenchoides bicaudatus]
MAQLSILLILLLLHSANCSIFEKVSKQQCQPISIPMCQNSPYNLTVSSNTLFKTEYATLQTQIEHYKPFIKFNCNPHIQFFICSVFAPMCPEQMPQPITTCRSVCEEVKRDCIKILNEFEVTWPEFFNCSNFPEEPDLCMKPPEQYPAPSFYANPPISSHDSFPTQVPMLNLKASEVPSCPHDLINLDPTDARGSCAFQCKKPTMFTTEKLQVAEGWILTGSSLNIAITGFTFLTFLIDRQRFVFPERAIFYVALCSMISSVPYLARSFLTYEQMVCDRLPTGRQFLVHAGLDNTTCVLSFLFNYYFSMASAVWWLTLTLTWYLSGVRKWAHEEIEKRANYFHLVAWGLPALPAITVLITQKVDASELFGVCSVGNLNPWTLISFVLIPRLLLITIGSCLIIVGFSSMFRERKSFKRRGIDTIKLERLMFKMGAFCTLFVLPTMILSLCEAYHFFVLYRWFPTTIDCKLRGGSAHCPRHEQPQAEVYLIAFIMSLASGISTSLWILSTKTLHSWRRFICCQNCSPKEKKSTLQSPITTYVPAPPNQQSQPQHPLIVQMINGQNHYIPLSMMTNSNGTSRPGYPASTESWKPPNAL